MNPTKTLNQQIAELTQLIEQDNIELAAAREKGKKEQDGNEEMIIAITNLITARTRTQNILLARQERELQGNCISASFTLFI